ncbi:MAG: hypothetical protein HOE48_13660 [Candidatus Latescibacteria bacterium]|nr:hypothetical protein [Candidatus Latescibacterota bacterium]MBT4138961.1 hypothetical protein [Candidatus Latescibacterota bacterium]
MRFIACVLLCLLGMMRPVPAADLQVVGGTAFDSNLYEALVKAQGGLVSRVSVTAKGFAWRGKLGVVQIEQQAGLKHIWDAASTEMQAGDVFVEQFFVHGITRVGKRNKLGIRTGIKFKQATRVPGEESYLRGVVDGDFFVPLGTHFISRVRFGFGGDDSRDVLLAEADYHSAGLDLVYARSRQFKAHVRFSRRWIDYDRAALVLEKSDQITALKMNQADQTSSLILGFQAYAGMLIQADYAFSRNRSNSFGYDYWSHRLQGMLVRPLFWKMDVQIFAQFHVRLYDDLVPNLIGQATETDAYEQSIGVLKMSRQISPKYVLAGQYGFYRNGARQGDGFYRKHVFSLMLEAKL